MNSPSDNIEKLLEDEDLPEIETKSEGLPLIRLPEEVAELNRPQKESGIEKREFTRIDISQKQLELKFANEQQFARQYIENISIGGVFVKTDLKPSMGSLMPIEFSIPQSEGTKNFKLMARVCRVAEGGVGLEFTNLSNDVRQELEKFVLSILPEGIGTSTRAKKSTIERLDKLREQKMEESKRIKSFTIQMVIVALLITFNLLLLRDLNQIQNIEDHPNDIRIQIEDKSISPLQVQSISREQDGSIQFELVDGTVLTSRDRNLEKQLPYQMRQTLHLLSSTPTLKPSRANQTQIQTHLRH